MKTELCNYKSSRKVSCPVCSKWISLIDEKAKPLLVNHSRVRCYASNQPISEKNQGVLFGDRHVYGLDYVRKNMERNGMSFSPEGQSEHYDETEMSKVYFL